MDDQNKNLILAVALSMLVIIGWSVLFPPPPPPEAGTETAATTLADGSTPAVPAASGDTPAAAGSGTAQTGANATTEAVIAELAGTPRIAIDTPRVTGSISLLGGRIDTLSLKDYRKSLDADSGIVQLLSPVGSEDSYQALYGWAPGGALDFADVPGPETVWTQASGGTLAPGAPVTLSWDNGKGLQFQRTIAIDDNYMFQITQSVTNNGDTALRLAPEARLERHGEPKGKRAYVVHEGAIRQRLDERDYPSYSDMHDYSGDNAWSGNGTVADVAKVEKQGWLGFTDHYWQAMLVPPQDEPYTSVLQYDGKRDIYRAIARLQTIEVAPGETKAVTSRLFAGAKEWATIRAYQNAPAPQGIAHFVDSIDWGWFFFLTKPMFAVLHWLHGFIGNMGWAIIGLTVVIKALVLPLAYKSYSSMAKMRELQPQMEALKEQCGDDRQKMQQEMMALYKREKVNPASGCLPILLQIPIFFSLYKVIYVTIELYQAPWIGWIRDLSQPDPSSILNLFGLLPFAAPGPGSFLSIISLGILPILLGVSMWLQQKLNQQPTDPTQRMIFAWMPWVFMFMLGSFASGLVLYWIANNTITFLQQYAIMRSHGYKPDVFGNIRSSFKRGGAE
ncbi:MAG: membrane protein insertase YidC [Paracoccaceae bacterium]